MIAAQALRYAACFAGSPMDDDARLADALARLLRRSMLPGSVASVLSLAALALAGRAGGGSAAGAVNAPSHWLHGDRALRCDAATPRYTLVGIAIHHVSSLWWAAIHQVLNICRHRPTPTSAVADAAVVAALAAVVDLWCVPRRLTPGFERRLSSRRLTAVYAAFGIGLAVGSIVAGRRR